MNSRLGDEGNVQNRDVKIFLYKQFNNQIDFAYSDSARKCLMVFYVLGNEASKEMTVTPETQADAEKFLVLVLSETSHCSTFTELRAQMYHQAKASSHQNLPSTTEGLLPHIMRAWLSTYSIIHLFQPSIFDPLQFGYYLQNDRMAPVTGCKNLKERWTCNCGKCARSACPCRMEEVGCTPFCKCMKLQNDACSNPFN